MSIRLLDCTLRDGGFINDWEFGHAQIVNIFERSIAAKIDIVEIGFIDERREFDRNRTIMPSGEAVNEIYRGLSSGESMIVGMIDYGTCNEDLITDCVDSFLDGIRVIFKKKNWPEALAFCKKIQDKGYKMFVQPVSITGYTDEEMLKLVQAVNELNPYAMSIVDTYGLLNQGNLLHYFELIDANLKADISMGYHAHNNFQLGYSNAIALIEKNKGRDLVIDGSIYGMGKGAGNVPLELIAMYMNDVHGKDYDINSILEALDTGIMDIYLKNPWGYSLKYYLAASNDCHPNYVQHLMQKRTLSVKSINEILASIDLKEKLAYNAEHIENLYQEYQIEEINDKKNITALSECFKDKEILVLGPGPNIELQKDKIKNYIDEKAPTVVAINFAPEGFDIDYVFLSNSKRYVEFSNRLLDREFSPKIIATSNVTKIAGEFDYTIDYSSLIDPDFEFRDSSFIMFIKLLTRVGVTKCALAGFDGYKAKEGKNYFNVAMEYAFVKEKFLMLNEYTSSALSALSKDIELNFVTDTEYVIK